MKPLFVISCPIDTYSGYGARSRDIVKSLIELNQYNIKVLPQKWGSTPWGFIKDHSEWEFLTPYLLPTGNQLPAKPKIWAQITVPNEFQAVGDYNIGFTAGIETTICAPQWIEGLNRMDLNIVSSVHSKNVFENSIFTKQDDQKNNLGQIKLQKPVEVLFEGADLTTYFPSKKTNNLDLDSIKENFAFLTTGHWMQGDLGEDRKNIGLTIRLFFETFKNQKNTPALILKICGGSSSYLDRDQILNKIHFIKESVEADILPNVYLFHGEISNSEMNDLYNHKKVKALVSLTKGEGFGRPLLEFSLTKKPIVTSNWSGHIDFLEPKFTTMVKGELKNVHKSASVKDVLLEESQWFAPDVNEISHHFRELFSNYKSYSKGTTLQYHKSKNNFSFEQMKDVLESYLTSYIPEFVEEVKLELPKLNLPKLKKLENV